MIRKAERKSTKIKLALQGTAGSGKTFSSILIAKGLSQNNLSKVCIIDTENGSADLYSHLGDYNVISLSPPFTPEKYIEAIKVCEHSDQEVIIIDSISPCWDELLEFHATLLGNSFTNWNKVTPRHKKFIDYILQSPTHIIVTMRTKQDYVINQKDGKNIPEKIGLKAIQREGIDYEFTIVLELNSNHRATASKDRTGLFNDKSNLLLDASIGNKIIEWCCINTGIKTENIALQDLYNQIQSCSSIQNLYELYKTYPNTSQDLLADYEIRKKQLTKNTIIN